MPHDPRKHLVRGDLRNVRCGWERAETTGMRGIAAEITHRDKCKGAKE